MTYEQFLFSELLSLASEEHRKMPYDIKYSNAIKQYALFERSSFYKDGEIPLYEAINNYLEEDKKHILQVETIAFDIDIELHKKITKGQVKTFYHCEVHYRDVDTLINQEDKKDLLESLRVFREGSHCIFDSSLLEYIEKIA